ncbi:hypothetical protein B9Z55_022971 [Caenorhabditis nigoni]|uniref:Uncharacterized protein n=1 Tax=Caenorhabditis nigoni TaxID=1611254 RepID=A0A2G5SMS2_9PELO|nr:hypothetical protein B9Z55_022971 [Caenorhabditis nigoni]
MEEMKAKWDNIITTNEQQKPTKGKWGKIIENDQLQINQLEPIESFHECKVSNHQQNLPIWRKFGLSHPEIRWPCWVSQRDRVDPEIKKV